MSAAVERADRIALGIAMMLLGAAAMTTMDALGKWLGASYAITQLVFFRNLFALLPVLLVIRGEGGVASLRTAHPFLHLLRGAFGLLAIYSFFFGLRYMPLAEAVAIAFLAPLFVTALSHPLLGERVGPRRWAAVVAGFLGALVILRPGSEAFRVEALLPALAALGYAVSMALTRKIGRRDGTAALSFYATASGLLFASLLLPWSWRSPGGLDLLTFIAMGVIGGMTTIFLTRAYRHAPPAVVAPFEYSALLWSVLLGWLLWGELPGAAVWLGAAILVGAGLYVLYRETSLSRQATERGSSG